MFVVGIDLLLLHTSGDHFTNKLPIKPVCNPNKDTDTGQYSEVKTKRFFFTNDMKFY